MELMLTLALMGACFGFGWIVGHAAGYEMGLHEGPRR